MRKWAETCTTDRSGADDMSAVKAGEVAVVGVTGELHTLQTMR
jgi:hypothetical protein